MLHSQVPTRGSGCQHRRYYSVNAYLMALEKLSEERGSTIYPSPQECPLSKHQHASTVQLPAKSRRFAATGPSFHTSMLYATLLCSKRGTTRQEGDLRVSRTSLFRLIRPRLSWCVPFPVWCKSCHDAHPLFRPHCTVYCPFRSGIPIISLLQNISRLYAAAGAALASMSPHSHLRCPDLQRQCYHQLPCPHEEFWSRSQAHRWFSEGRQ
jgi:hypothetical protein